MADLTPIPMGIPWDPWDPSLPHSHEHLEDRRTDRAITECLPAAGSIIIATLMSTSCRGLTCEQTESGQLVLAVPHLSLSHSLPTQSAVLMFGFSLFSSAILALR